MYYNVYHSFKLNPSSKFKKIHCVSKSNFISEDSGLLRYYGVLLGEWFLMFWRNVIPLKHPKQLTHWQSIVSQNTWTLWNDTQKIPRLI